ncbi:MAG: hypothetical protein D3910_13215 [Candidatus Electrothrix sp. ATG2]|nr:hypothetical protein [Candidatus Electrothrix sp. ATG2]
MSKAGKKSSSKKDELLLLHRIERFNLLVLALLIIGSWYLVDWFFARSVLVGGALSSGSFFWLKRTALRFIRHAARSGADEQGNAKPPSSSSFAVKFTVRLLVLAFLLLLVNTQFSINAIGLVIGLSTVMLSVVIVVLFQGRMIFQENM